MSGKTSEYADVQTGEPQDVDKLDISVRVSVGPDVYVSMRMDYSNIKRLGPAIAEDIVATGTGTGIGASSLKAADLDLDEGIYFGHKDFLSFTEFFAYFDPSDGSFDIRTPTGTTANFGVGGSSRMRMNDTGVDLSTATGKLLSIGTGVTSLEVEARVHIRGLGNDDTTEALTISNLGGGATHILRLGDSGLLSLSSGTGVNNISIDDTLTGITNNDLVGGLALKTYIDNNSSGGWNGSQTRIKIAAWDFKSYNDKDGVTYQDDGGSVSDGGSKITEIIAGVYIPSGYRAIAFMVYASSALVIEIFENQIDDDTAVSKGTGNANTEVDMTDVDSTTDNYLSITLVEAGSDILGAYVTIEKIP